MIITRVVQKLLNLKRGKITFLLQNDLNAPSIIEPICEDFDGKGSLTVLSANQKGEILAFTEEGAPHWKFQSKEDVSKLEQMFLDSKAINSINSSPTVRDIDGDGIKEILFGTELGFIYALNSQGKKIWSFKADGSIRGRVNVLDVNDDDELEIIFGTMSGKIYILRTDGQIITKINTKYKIENTPIIFNGLIIVGTSVGKLCAFSLDGEERWSINTNSKITAEPVIANLKKGKTSLIVGSTDNNLYCIDEEGNIRWIFETEGSIYSKVLITDINGDGDKEIIFGSCDNNVYVLNSNGVMMWAFKTDFWVVGSPVLMDIDNDRKKEIIFGSYDNQIYVLSAEGAYTLGYIPGVSSIVTQEGNYSEIPTHDPGEIVGKKIWMLKTSGIIVGCCQVRNKLAVQTKDGKLAWIKHEVL